MAKDKGKQSEMSTPEADEMYLNPTPFYDKRMAYNPHVIAALESKLATSFEETCWDNINQKDLTRATMLGGVVTSLGLLLIPGQQTALEGAGMLAAASTGFLGAFRLIRKTLRENIPFGYVDDVGDVFLVKHPNTVEGFAGVELDGEYLTPNCVVGSYNDWRAIGKQQLLDMFYQNSQVVIADKEVLRFNFRDVYEGKLEIDMLRQKLLGYIVEDVSIPFGRYTSAEQALSLTEVKKVASTVLHHAFNYKEMYEKSLYYIKSLCYINALDFFNSGANTPVELRNDLKYLVDLHNRIFGKTFGLLTFEKVSMSEIARKYTKLDFALSYDACVKSIFMTVICKILFERLNFNSMDEELKLFSYLMLKAI